MNDQAVVATLIRDILSDFEPFTLTDDRRWDAGLWAALTDVGLTSVGIPEEAGGSGGELADSVVIIRTLAAGAAAVPVAEQLLVVGPALLAAGMPLPDPSQPTGIALADTTTAEFSGGRWHLTGPAVQVAWAGVVSHVVIVARGPDGPVLAMVPGKGAIEGAANLAGEPRGWLPLDGVPVLRSAALQPDQVSQLHARFALARAVQLAAGLEQVLAWTVQYAGERQQFGRALAKFQAIQMDLARMAGEVSAVTALTDAAVQALSRSENELLAAAAAKVRAGAAVEVVARLAHQVHGAMGFTQEYKLHHLTRRLWAWRDEAGSELDWSRVLGAGLVADGAENLWSRLTRVV